MPYVQKIRFQWTRKTTANMGRIDADLELINGKDAEAARNNEIGEDELRRMPIRAQVDTGSEFMCINENIQEILQLPFIRKRRLILADGQPEVYNTVGPLEIRFKNRIVDCAVAVVLPGSSDPLLGLFPLEHMDVVIDPRRNELIVNPDHPDYAEFRV